jgi:hypothetical protein
MGMLDVVVMTGSVFGEAFYEEYPRSMSCCSHWYKMEKCLWLV